MIVVTKILAAVTATEEIALQIPVGARLKQVSIQNVTDAWNKGTIMLSTQDFLSGTGKGQIGLLHEAIQAGSRYITWRGNEKIDDPYVFVIGQFFSCTAADELWLVIGYEMPPSKKGWGS